jgi:hypothetical protein
LKCALHELPQFLIVLSGKYLHAGYAIVKQQKAIWLLLVRHCPCTL